MCVIYLVIFVDIVPDPLTAKALVRNCPNAQCGKREWLLIVNTSDSRNTRQPSSRTMG